MGSIINSTAADDKSKTPVKTRELYHHHVNSEIWNDFSFRSDDIVIATWAKSGTTVSPIRLPYGSNSSRQREPTVIRTPC